MTADRRTTYRPARLAAHELVLLHGQPGSPADLQPVTARLPAQLHAIAADRPGYGSSRLPAGGFAAGARAVLDDLDARGITRAVLVGHSYGGGVALAAAALAPRRVEAVILLRVRRLRVPHHWPPAPSTRQHPGRAGRPGRVHYRRGM
jgi:pimeloyl-ACP methyl ester carboxylesterase